VEVDGYFGYSIETDAGFSASLGFTGYYYTGKFDNTYEGINLNLDYKIVSLEYSVGEWDGFGAAVDYDFLAVLLKVQVGSLAPMVPSEMISMVITLKLAMAHLLLVSMWVFPPSSVPMNYPIRLTVMEMPQKAKLSCSPSVRLSKTVGLPT
jgi:hypothetical protein